MHASHKGLWAVHSAVFLFGLTALFSKLIALPALEITLLRSLFAVLALWGVMRWQGEPLGLQARQDYAIVLLLGVLLAGHWVTYFHAMQVSSIAVGVIALYTFPVITVFLEPLFHGERPHWIDVISGAGVVFGIYLLVPEFHLDDTTTRGVLWGILSALLFSLRNIIQGRYFNRYPAKQALMYQILITIVVLLPFGSAVIPQVSSVQWGQLLLLGVVFTALPHTLFAFSLRHFKAKTASLVACLQVVYATLFAAWVLGEWPVLTTVAGGVIVVTAAMFETYMAGRRR
ncbi:DMT family transporter [Thiohalophilus sp.]|uniref:DMT family transporter n=1 Tax=Thiohalophilus sp. TaxID=3028392 RepID=UPI002ACE68C5|nr:DMT family transporter [Thiohalophilus sp.]MDZ7805282.1 DMT family transporter [Thiohalophilus sp.]